MTEPTLVAIYCPHLNRLTAWLYEHPEDAERRACEVGDLLDDGSQIFLAPVPIRDRFRPLDETPMDETTFRIENGRLIPVD